MDFRKRRRLIASKIKPLSLYEAGWSGVQNCDISNSQVYSFKSGYVQVGSDDSSEAAYGRLTLKNIVNLSKYRRLCITYLASSSSCTIRVGNVSSSNAFTSTQTGSLVTGTEATVSFNVDPSWSAVNFYASGRSTAVLKIYKIWLEG